MVKNILKRGRKKTWSCPYNCDLLIGSCPHLEDELPSMDTGLRSYKYLKEYVYFEDRRPYYEINEEVEHIFKLLKEADLTSIEADLIIDKYYGNMPDLELRREYDISRVSLSRYIDSAIGKLKNNKEVFAFFKKWRKV